MPRQSVPSYRLHKPSGQARTIILGSHIYLGKYNAPESREKYARLLAELSQPNSTADDSGAAHGIQFVQNDLPLCVFLPKIRNSPHPTTPGKCHAYVSGDRVACLNLH